MSEAARETSSEEIQAAEAQAVAEILDRDARQKAVQAHKAAKRSWRPSAMSMLAVVLGVLSIGLWFSNPEWLRPERPPAPSTAHLEKSGRVALFMIATRIEDFRTLKGRLPGTLEEIGRDTPGVEYKFLDNERYRLIYRTSDGIEMAYDSAQNMSSFLGNALSDLGMLGDGK